MLQHKVKILETQFITHDVKRFVVERPEGYNFIPGQATDVSINLPGWENKLRAFTFTGLMEWNHLEFTIKIYKNRDGVTAQLGKLNAGAELFLHDVFGTIEYKSSGVFIAAGAGITPFIAIFRELYKHHLLRGMKLIYSNKTSEDIIYRDELQKMLKDNFINIFTREHVIGFLDRRIDRNFLIENIPDFAQHFYICGPDAFVSDVKKNLLELGASSETLVFEQ